MNTKKTLTGTVVSNKMDKTIIVVVEKKMIHKQYRKVMTTHKKYKAHCVDSKKIKIGDMVTIVETRPIAKGVHFMYQATV